ncbi:YggS family pyridoxal phosphate-dependent enzyme [bacterium]|nr:YggS family pyridoxal phosphate-dependent enzyme [bacterium]
MINLSIKNNLLKIQEQIVPYTPDIIAVTKYYGLEAIIDGYEVGLRNFGESRAVDAIKKIEMLPQEIRSNSKFHFIGHLQSNKAAKVVKNFDVIHSIDSVKIAEIVSKEALLIGKVQNILLQVNNACEEQKCGFSKQDLLENFHLILGMKGIRILGLMNIAPLDADEQELEVLFEDIKQTQDSLNSKFNLEMRDISMGMSNDYHIAVKHGATMLRIGRKLFST